LTQGEKENAGRGARRICLLKFVAIYKEIGLKYIVKWLRKIEHQANEVYMRAADLYVDDPKLWKFLEHSSEDEAWHYHVMGSAADFLSSASEVIPAISIL
jgi:hypothetical protein